MTVYIMNTTGLFSTMTKYSVDVEEISKEDVLEYLHPSSSNLIIQPLVNAIGHEATLDLWNEIFPQPEMQLHKEFVEINGMKSLKRISVDFKENDYAICFQLKSRLPVIKDLTKEELDKLDYKFILLHIVKQRNTPRY